MFMDRESRLFLNLGNPVGIIEKPSQAVLRGIKYDTLIDIDEVTGIQISPEHKAVHDKVIKKLGLARLDKKAEDAAKADIAKYLFSSVIFINLWTSKNAFHCKE